MMPWRTRRWTRRNDNRAASAQPAVEERHADERGQRDDAVRDQAIGPGGGEVEQPGAGILGDDLQRPEQQRSAATAA